MTSLIGALRNWINDPAKHYIYGHFPDPKAEVDPLVPASHHDGEGDRSAHETQRSGSG